MQLFFLAPDSVSIYYFLYCGAPVFPKLTFQHNAGQTVFQVVFNQVGLNTYDEEKIFTTQQQSMNENPGQDIGSGRLISGIIKGIFRCENLIYYKSKKLNILTQCICIRVERYNLFDFQWYNIAYLIISPLQSSCWNHWSNQQTYITPINSDIHQWSSEEDRFLLLSVCTTAPPSHASLVTHLGYRKLHIDKRRKVIRILGTCKQGILQMPDAG